MRTCTVHTHSLTHSNSTLAGRRHDRFFFFALTMLPREEISKRTVLNSLARVNVYGVQHVTQIYKCDVGLLAATWLHGDAIVYMCIVPPTPLTAKRQHLQPSRTINVKRTIILSGGIWGIVGTKVGTLDTVLNTQYTLPTYFKCATFFSLPLYPFSILLSPLAAANARASINRYLSQTHTHTNPKMTRTTIFFVSLQNSLLLLFI